MKYKSIRGFNDILPKEVWIWQGFEAISRKIFRAFNYQEIRTPVVEEVDLFKKSVGEDTDIVNKEMFAFLDRGGREVCLRPEGTAAVIRAYLENSIYKTEPFQKFYYIAPMFRSERPQAGRLRQFHQIGVEAIGSATPAIDAEVVGLLTKVLDSCGIKGYRVKLNNLGCRDDKKKLYSILKELLTQRGASKILCKDCKKRLKTNPLRVLDCKNEECKGIVRGVFKETDFLCGACKHHFEKVSSLLNLLKVRYEIDPYIVRGLDYYTSTVFEVVHPFLGAQDAIGAGGRYDNLINDLGGPKVGACGFALGADRMEMVLGERSNGSGSRNKIDVFVASIGALAYEKAFSLLSELRNEDIPCDMDYQDKSLKSQMRSADRLGAKFVLIIGEDELREGSCILRDMGSKEQTSVRFGDIVKRIKEMRT